MGRVGAVRASSPKKATVKKTAASTTASRASNPRTNSVTTKTISRNIVGFYMTENIEIRRATQSDNMTNDRLKVKYAQLKKQIKAR